MVSLPTTTDQRIVARASVQRVVAGEARDDILLSRTVQHVIARGTYNIAGLVGDRDADHLAAAEPARIGDRHVMSCEVAVS